MSWEGEAVATFSLHFARNEIENRLSLIYLTDVTGDGHIL
jgi:hypothetical protein